MQYNDGGECRVYRPVAGTLNMLDETRNTSMVNMQLSHTIQNSPRPVKQIASVTEEDLDRVLDGYTKGIGTRLESMYDNNKAKERILARAKGSNN
jgi:hypothetical protein